MADETTNANAATNTPHIADAPGAPLTPSGAPLAMPAPESVPASIVTVPTPSVAPTPTPVPAANAPTAPDDAPKDLQNDINSILQGVKLPEREHPQNTAPAAAKQFDTALAGSVDTPPATPGAPAIPAPIAPSDALASVHTFRQDMQEVVQEQKISRVRAVALETEKRRPEPIDDHIPKRRSPLVPLLIIGVFILLAGAAVFGVYTYFATNAAPSQNGTLPDSLVFVESTQTISIDDTYPAALKTTLAAYRTQGGPTLGSIMRVAPITSAGGVPRAATFAEFMQAIGAHPPDELLRALSDTFFFGFHTIDKNAPVLVIPVTSYDHAFAGMLAWEASLNADLAPIFAAVPPFTTAADGSVATRTFTDNVMRNYDIRQLTDDSGAVLLYYSFPTRGMLIIAESPYSFPEVITRLQAARRL